MHDANLWLSWVSVYLTALDCFLFRWEPLGAKCSLSPFVLMFWGRGLESEREKQARGKKSVGWGMAAVTGWGWGFSHEEYTSQKQLSQRKQGAGLTEG